jgi:glutathione S-transferase
MTHSYSWVALVTLLSLLVYFWMGLRVAGARRKTGIHAPAMSGDPLLDRNVRVQANTLEWLPIFLPSLWLFAIYWDDRIAAALGAVWIAGRILYALGYVADPTKRAAGFGTQFAAAAVLLLGAMAGIVMSLAAGGAIPS